MEKIKEFMNNKIVCVLLILVAVLIVFTGCTTREEEQMQYKTEGIMALNKGDYENAVKLFEKALSKSGGTVGTNEIDICYYKAAAQYNMADFEGAIDTYTSLIEFDEKDPYPLFLRGSVYAKEANKESALDDYKKAISVDEENYDLYIAIYENLMSLNLQNEAEEFLNIALEKSGDSKEDCIARGKIYTILKQYDAAKTAYEKAIDKGSEDAEIYLAELYYETGENEDADEILEKFKEKNSIDSVACNAIGVMELKRGNYEDALMFFDKGLEGFPSNKKELTKNKVAALEGIGKFQEAIELANEYVLEYPADSDMLREIQFMKTR